jgi:hypothetical protein
MRKAQMKEKRKKLELRSAGRETKPQLTAEEESEPEEKREQLQVQEAEARVALRLPSDLHDEVRRIAKREKLNLHDTLVRLIEHSSENGSGTLATDEYQQFRDMMELCKLLGVEKKPALKRALAERGQELYDLPIELDDMDSDDAALRTIREEFWELNSKAKEPFSPKDSPRYAGKKDREWWDDATLPQMEAELKRLCVSEREIEKAKQRAKEKPPSRTAGR